VLSCYSGAASQDAVLAAAAAAAAAAAGCGGGGGSSAADGVANGSSPKQQLPRLLSPFYASFYLALLASVSGPPDDHEDEDRGQRMARRLLAR
jgi:hypothetical protein